MRFSDVFRPWEAAISVVVIFGLTAGSYPIHALDDLEKRASWQLRTWQDVNPQFELWIESLDLGSQERQRVIDDWRQFKPAAQGSSLLEHVGRTIAIADSRAADLVSLCEQSSWPRSVPKFDILWEDTVAPFVKHNLRLLYGRWLVQHDLISEANVIFEGLNPQDVVDPASLFFYDGVVSHRLIEKKACLLAISRLLEHESSIPQRYANVARLMEADLKPMKVDSLDEVSRIMDRVRIRLDLGRAGERVRKDQKDVVAKLDKMIEELEKQQQQQQQSGGGGKQNPSQPMQDSQAADLFGPGNVDPKKLAENSDWGDLPAKQRQEALQQISRDFPAHYRDVIERYFRKIAQEKDAK